jgi:hypothetical protein
VTVEQIVRKYVDTEKQSEIEELRRFQREIVTIHDQLDALYRRIKSKAPAGDPNIRDALNDIVGAMGDLAEAAYQYLGKAIQKLSRTTR